MLSGKKTGRIAGIAAAAIVGFIIIVILFISPIAKYAIEKYSPALLGRQVKLSWIYINPFTGSVYISNLKVYEQNGDSIFLSGPGVSAHFAMLKMFSKTYEFTSLTLDKPRIEFVLDHKAFNLDDVIKRFTPKEPRDTTKGPVHFNLLNIRINDGEIHYNQPRVPVYYYIKHLNIKSGGLRWNADTIASTLAFENGPAEGHINGYFVINTKNLDYRFTATVNKYDMGIIEQYLRALTNFGTMTANLDANLSSTGNFKDALNMNSKGYVAINDLHLSVKPGVDYASFKKFAINIIELNPKDSRYYLDTIMVDTPFFEYARYDYLDNVQRIFGKNGEVVMNAKSDSTKFNLILKIADYINILAHDFIKSQYKVNRVAIYRGNLDFRDYSLREKFEAAAAPLYIVTDTIDKNNQRWSVNLKTNLQPFGSIHADLSIDPNDYGYFDFNYKLKKVPVSLFNPYLITYTSFPLDRGALEVEGSMNVMDSNINCNNHLLILDPRVGKRLRKKDTKWIPMPLIMSIVREPSDVIDYEIPLRGKLSDPKFNLWNAIGHIIANIFIKPPATPYLFHVKHLESVVEKSFTITWATRENQLRPSELKFVKQIVDFLKANPNARITVSALEYAEKEKEYILLYEAKRKYFMNKMRLRTLSESDSVFVDKMSVKDSAFVKFLDKLTKDTMLFTIQGKCKYYLGDGPVEAHYRLLLKQREDNFRAQFKQDGVEDRVKLLAPQEGCPFNGFSYYKISYNGEFPKSLVNAYEKMNELNEEAPRGKYQKARQKNGGVLLEETANTVQNGKSEK